MHNTVCDPCRQILRTRFSQKLLSFQNNRRGKKSLSWYWDTVPPTEQQLVAAKWFFQQHRPKKLWTATEWRTQNNDDSGILTPEVLFVGRSNVGKSSLLNAVLEAPMLNRVGPRPGKTTVMHAWGLSPTKASGGLLPGWKGESGTRLTVIDAPGYGFRSLQDWGKEITTYLNRRKHLRRVFMLIDASHGVKDHDKMLLNLLRQNSIPYQLIVSKVERKKSDLVDTMRNLQLVAQPRSPQHTMTGLGELLVVGGLQSTASASSGVADVQWAILRATGLDEFAVENFIRLNKAEAASYSTTPLPPNAVSPLIERLPSAPLPTSATTPSALSSRLTHTVRNAEPARPTASPSERTADRLPTYKARQVGAVYGESPPARTPATNKPRSPLRSAPPSSPYVHRGAAAMEAVLGMDKPKRGTPQEPKSRTRRKGSSTSPSPYKRGPPRAGKRSR